jgi:hypothetical protein|tara:strand:+ start:1097 stop:1381 length:285 start_codon:yes stop_codon:yes gene_type:complete
MWVFAGLFSLGSVSSIFSNIKESFFPLEKTYSLEAVELILKHNKLKEQIKALQIENQIIEKDNERISKSISADSNIVYNSSRAYRDSLRTELFK